MHRLGRGMRLVIATHNPGKLGEIAALLEPFGIEALAAAGLGLAEPAEPADTFAGNALIKATAAAAASGRPALADDSGLEIELLAGAPGVRSARWAGAGGDFGAALHRVHREIERRQGWAAPGPRANFTCVLCLAWPGGEHHLFEGRVDGRLVWPPRGDRGFGYDPIFVADGEMLTFGEMEPARKHAISHRARAFARLLAGCIAGGEP